MKKKIISIILVLTLIASVVVLYNQFSSSDVEASEYRNGYSIVPQFEDSTGVLLDSYFDLYIEDETEYTTSELEEMIEFSHGDFSISKEDDKYVIKPFNKLEKNKIVQFVISNENKEDIKFTFQTASDLQIISSFPADKSTGVPLNSGIEIYFNKTGISDLDDYFSIKPNVKGNFEIHKNVLVFIPEKLEPETVYTIELKKGISIKEADSSIDEDYSFSFETALDEKTGNIYYNNGHINFTREIYEYTTNDELVVPIYYYINREYHDETTYSLDTAIYNFKSIDEFKEALEEKNQFPSWTQYSYQKATVDTKNLSKVLEKTIDIKTNPKSDEDRLLTYDYKLPKGFYLIELEFDEQKVQAFIQVSNIGVFQMNSVNKNIFWVKDMIHNDNVEDAVLALDDENLYNSDSEGIIFAELNVTEDKKFATLTKDDNSILITLYNNQIMPYRQSGDDYWNYLFTDRALYKPSDEVRYFGYLKNRKEYTDEIDEVTVEVSQGGYYPMYRGGQANYDVYFPSMNEPIMRFKTKVEKDSYFGSFDLPSLQQGTYTIAIKHNDQEITRKYFTVEKYTKPDYKIEISKDKNAIFLDETVNFKIKSAFYEGTAVANLDFRYNINNSFGVENVSNIAKTNVDGEYTIPYTPDKYNDAQGMRYANININVVNPEIGEIYENDRVNVFINDIYPEYEGRIEDGNLKLNSKTYFVDLSNLNDDDPATNGYEGEAAKSVNIKGQLIKVTYKKVETGTYYDFVNKLTRKNYRYERKEEVIDQIDIVTNDLGEANYEFEIDENFDGYYYAKVMFEDSKGREVKDKIHFRNYVKGEEYLYRYYNNGSRLELEEERSYKENEEVKMEYIHMGEEVSKGDFIYITMQNGIVKYEMSNDSNYSFIFSKEDIPNVYIGAVYFTGKTFEYVSTNINYEYEEKRMNIEAKFDKESYRPGDIVEMIVNTTDKDNMPTSAVVNISIVDEAMFSLRDQDSNLLSNLYTTVSSGVNYTASTHNFEQNNIHFFGRGGFATEDSMDESMDMDSNTMQKNDTIYAASGESVNVRSDFRDTAKFLTVHTDENGLAIVEYKIPDNITSWRVTMQGISNDLEAGTGIESVDVSLPFFINYSLSDTFIKGDTPYIGITCYGSELDKNDKVEVEIEGVDKTYILKPFEREYVKLDRMDEVSKDNKIIIMAQTDSGLKDAIEHTYSVYESYHEIDITKQIKAEVGMSLLSGEEKMTSYRFINSKLAKYASRLYSLTYMRGNRIEQRLVKNEARKLLNNYLNNEYELENIDYSEYQKPDGGIAFLPYGNSDITTTVDVLAYIKDEIDIKALKNYLNSIRYSKTDKESYIKALYGLSLLGEPVLTELKNFEEIDNQSIVERIYTAMAYEAFEETQVARRIYFEHILENIYVTDDYARVEEGKDIDEKLKNTAMLTMLAYEIDVPEKEKLYDYISKEYTKEYLIILEKLACITNELSNEEIEEAKISYTYLDKNHEYELGVFGKTITIPSQMSDELEINKVEGDIDVIAVYKGYEEIKEDNRFISVERSYSNYTRPNETITKNDIVKITLEINIDNNAIDLNYGLTDYLPSGLRAIENSCRSLGIRDRSINYYVNIDGQKVYFNFYGSRKENKTYKVNYLARVVNPGVFTAEKAVLRGYNDKSSVAFTKREIIEILN